MTHLESILGTLLLRNNCVIIPSLGGFVADYVSARIDSVNGVIQPPSKAIRFNKNLTTNDGLLIQAIATEFKLTFEEAKQVVSKETHTIKQDLEAGKRIHFNNVGFLYTNAAGKLAFEQDRFFNLLLSTYGLGKVHFIAEEEVVTPQPEVAPVITPTVTSSPVMEIEEVEEEKEIVHPAAVDTTPTRSIYGRIAKYAAVAALIPMVFYSFWIPVKTDVLSSKIIYSNDFNPFFKTGKATYSTSGEELNIDKIKERETFLVDAEDKYPSVEFFSYPIDESLQITVKKDIQVEDITEKHDFATYKPYHAIVGCFSSEQNAQNLIQDLQAKGIQAYEVDVKGGLHRISAGNAESTQALREIRLQLESLNFSSWVLKK